MLLSLVVVVVVVVVVVEVIIRLMMEIIVRMIKTTTRNENSGVKWQGSNYEHAHIMIGPACLC